MNTSQSGHGSAGQTRIDSATRLIHAPAQKIYDALLDRESMMQWRPPEGMEAKVNEFNPREGGSYRMAFIYKDISDGARGKTTENADMITGRFTELRPGKCIVEIVNFESGDPAFAGEMKITTQLMEMPGGTEVTFYAENVPAGISPEDHRKGMQSTLANLAAFVE